MTPLRFLVLCLAASAVVDVWRRGSLFQDLRQQVHQRAIEECPSWRRGPSWWLARLLDCSFCLSYWAPPLLLLAAATGWWGPLYALAATRVCVLANGLLPEHLSHDYDPLATTAPYTGPVVDAEEEAKGDA
jgi:hypothetical protein